MLTNFVAYVPGDTPISHHAPAHLDSRGYGNGTLRLRNERIYFLFIFFFVAYILSAGHTMYAPRVQSGRCGARPI